MRLIGHLSEEHAARLFADYLYVRQIDNHLEFEKADGWGIWVNDEDKVQDAAQLLAEFQSHPTDPKYQAGAQDAASLRAQAEKSEATYRKKVQDRRQLFRPLTAYGFGPLTFVLIVICVVVAFLSRLGESPGNVMGLFVTDYSLSANMIEWHRGLPEIRHGQLWRLITPIFIHFGVLHLLFNMLWLRDLGSMIEARHSWWYLLLLVVVIAACSNLAQFFFSGPMFGGMSGVVYGLLGYIWTRGKFDPASGLFLHPTTVVMMLIWFVACFTPLIPHVANATHAVGLAMGCAWGYLSYILRYR